MARQIALLRAVNLGSRNQVKMARLRELMDELGYTDVRTYVQSGNVVFTGPDDPPAKVTKRLEKQLAVTFGFEIPVMIRSRDELADVVRANPLGDVATEPSRHHVMFLAEEIDPARFDDVDPAQLVPEAFHIRGREVFVWTPEGVRTSRVMKTFSEKRLGVAATMRNWRTVETLLALADEVS